MKTLRGLISFGLLITAVYLLWQVLPPFFRNYQFQDAIETTARFSSVDPRAGEEDIRQKVYRSAQDFQIPLTPEQINVSRNGNEVAIWADYIVRVNVPGRPVDLEFHPATKNKPIM